MAWSQAERRQLERKGKEHEVNKFVSESLYIICWSVSCVYLGTGTSGLVLFVLLESVHSFQLWVQSNIRGSCVWQLLCTVVYCAGRKKDQVQDCMTSYVSLNQVCHQCLSPKFPVSMLNYQWVLCKQTVTCNPLHLYFHQKWIVYTIHIYYRKYLGLEHITSVNHLSGSQDHYQQFLIMHGRKMEFLLHKPLQNQQ